MTLTFISNFINHHQVYLADEFYRILGDDYKFIETMPMPQWLIDSGYPTINRPYIINGYTSSELIDKALKIAYDSDVVVIGSAPESFVSRRIKDNKLTFRYHERWFKSKPWYLTGPRGWMNIYNEHLRYRNKKLYMLCASAYTAKDVNTIGCYINKCFKWGYFTKVEEFDVEVVKRRIFRPDYIIKVMWCSRFVKLKHPELPIIIADRLKRRGYHFQLNMFGNGEELDRTKSLAQHLCVDDVVNFCGNRPNDQILDEMREHDIFLFTSDRNEGWGAVLNESMSCGCVPVASNAIGAAPFLIDNGNNGLLFRSEDIDSLEERVCILMNNNDLLYKLSVEAYHTMRNIWSPKNAAEQFLKLVDCINNNDATFPGQGPCSRAK